MLFGSKRLIINEFAKYLGIPLYHFKTYLHFKIPDWIIYNLPDGLWVFSLTSFLLMVWNFRITFKNILWVASGFIIMVIAEFLQLFHIIRGTFDYYDLLYSFIGFILPISLIFLKIKKYHIYENA